VIALDLKGVSVSGGSACHSGATEPSHVLMAMGVNKTRARASLRFSLLKTVTERMWTTCCKCSPKLYSICARFRRLRGNAGIESFLYAAKEPGRVYDTTERIQIWLLIVFLLQIASSAVLDSTS